MNVNMTMKGVKMPAYQKFILDIENVDCHYFKQVLNE